jgi:RND family efflux transporter MFP subunit
MKWQGWFTLCAASLPSVSGAATFACLIEAAQVVEVRAPVEGVIARVNVQRGDLVSRGQVLVELKSDIERLAVESARFRSDMDGPISAARNRVEYSSKKLARVKELAQENFVSAQAHDEAEAERRLAESELQAAVENRDLARIEYRRAVEQLALRSLKSPFSGVVVDRILNPGDLSEAGTARKPVLKVAQIDPLRVDIVLPGSVFAQVKAGMKASVLPQGGSVRYTATIKVIDKLIDAASSTFIARVELANPKHAVPAGVRCAAEIEGIVVPPDAPRAKP